MKKIFTKKRIFIALLIIFAIIMLLPGLLLFIFEWPSDIKNVVAAWKAEGTLTYFCAALSTVSTVFLGCATLYQAHIFQKREDVRARADTQRPFFIESNISATDKAGNALLYSVDTNRKILESETDIVSTISMKNCGDGIAYNLIIYPISSFGEAPADCFNCQTIAKNDFLNHKISTQNATTHQLFTIYYQNVVGFTYSQNFEVAIKHHSFGNNLLEACEEHIQLEIFSLSHQTEHPELQLKNGKYFNTKTKGYIEQSQTTNKKESKK